MEVFETRNEEGFLSSALSGVKSALTSCFMVCPCWNQEEGPLKLLEELNVFTHEISDDEDDEDHGGKHHKLQEEYVEDSFQSIASSSTPPSKRKSRFGSLRRGSNNNNNKNTNTLEDEEDDDEDLEGDELEFDTGSTEEDADQGVMIFPSFEDTRKPPKLDYYDASLTTPSPSSPASTHLAAFPMDERGLSSLATTITTKEDWQ
jgi:hypothetical protein